MNPFYNPVFLGKIAKSYLTDVDRVKKSTEKQIRKYQDKSLRKIVKYAYTVPLYHKKYKQAGIHPNDINGVEDIKKLPYVTKLDFRNASSETLLPKGADFSKYSRVSTSGSTGKPVTLYSDAYTIFHTFIGFIRSIREHNINWRKNRMALIADLSPDSAEEAYFSRTAMPNLKTFFSLDNMKVFHVGEKPEKLITEIEAFNPEFIGGYPGILKILAILKRKDMGKNLQPRVIATSGAVVDEYTRNYIKTTFNADIFDAYGATECSPMAFQCRKGNYHINTDFVLMEFLDPKEKEKTTGDTGNIVVTRLFGRGTPVIRYSGINDIVVKSDKNSECDIKTPLIERIEGRQVDSIILPNGDMIPPSSFTGIPYKVMLKYNTQKIQQFQIIQQSRNEIDILIVIDEKLRNIAPSVSEMFDEIKKQYVKKLGNQVNINVKEVDKIHTVRVGSATPPPIVISKVN